MLEKLPSFVGKTLARVRPGFDRIVSERAGIVTVPSSLFLESPAFAEGRSLPARCTADGEGISPPLRWFGVPAAARSLILLVEDCDSPTPSPLVHAIATGIPTTMHELAEGALHAHDGAPLLGKNSYFQASWLPPDPPPGHGTHRYVFQMFALDYVPQFEGPPGRSLILRALDNHVVARGQVIGTYKR
jgi:Raf kinase inhibitor-like YbhB/YbcL family protein